MKRLLSTALLFCLFITSAQAERLNYLEQLPIETFKKLREVERHQIGVSERLYIKGEYEAALNEYEKFITLYENSIAAPYAQLMWSHCQVRLRKANTGIRDGFQSVIDYWPESNEATLAAFLIARTNKDIGMVQKADKAYRDVMEAYPDHYVAFLSKVDLLDLAKVKKDDEAKLRILRELTYDTERTDQTRGHIHNASRELCSHYFYRGVFDEGLKALETTHKERDLAHHLFERVKHPLLHLTGTEENREKGYALADEAKTYLLMTVPDDIVSEGNKKYAQATYFRVADIEAHARRGEERIMIYEKMVQLFGADDAILGKLAEWYRSAKRDDEAITFYGKFQNAVEGQRGIVSLWRERNKWKEAIDGYQSLIQVDPDRAAEYLWATAECYSEQGDFKQAISAYRQTDNYPEAYFRMAWCQRRLKAYKEALILYNLAKAHKNQIPRAMLDIASTYEDMGEKEKAIKTYQATCRTYPKTEQASRAHAHLQTRYKISVTLGGSTDK